MYRSLCTPDTRNPRELRQFEHSSDTAKAPASALIGPHARTTRLSQGDQINPRPVGVGQTHKPTNTALLPARALSVWSMLPKPRTEH